MRSSRAYHIRRERELAALVAAARQEVVDVLADMGTVTVAELAAALGRPADALYFHLRALVRAGLVKPAGHRSRSGRKEALFRTIAPELRLTYDPHSAANRRAVSAIVASMLRLGVRDFRRAFQRENVIVSGPRRELWALRRTGRLSPDQLACVNRCVEDLAQEVSSHRGGRRLYAVTVVLTPLDHRANDGTGTALEKRKQK